MYRALADGRDITISGFAASNGVEGEKMYSLANVLDQEVLHIQFFREGEWFIAKCVDIPGCISQGRTKEEAMANIQDAIDGCLSVIREDLHGSEPDDNEFSMEIIPMRISGKLPRQTQ